VGALKIKVETKKLTPHFETKKGGSFKTLCEPFSALKSPGSYPFAIENEGSFPSSRQFRHELQIGTFISSSSSEV